MILFHDVDGCLNPQDGSALAYEGHLLSRNARSSLAQLGRALDNSSVECFVLNTGRSWPASKHLCEAIDSPKVQYAFTEHATQLWSLATGERVDLVDLSKTIGAPHVESALERVHAIEQLITWFASHGATQLADQMGIDDPIAVSMDKTSNLTFSIPLGADGEYWIQTLRTLINSSFDGAADTFTYHHSAPDGFIDVMPEIDKGVGVALMRALFDADQTTVAVGNGLNDLPMLEAADIAVCPANAEPDVLDYCARQGAVCEARYIGATIEWLAQR